MKVFSKFLAVILALVTVLTLIPFSVFAKASDPWLEVEGSAGTDAPVLTLKVDAGALMELLRADDTTSALLPELQSGVALDFASLANVFTAAELFEIIPKEEWLKVLPLEDIVDQIGVEKLKTYIDIDALAKEVDKEEIKKLLADIDDLSKVVDFSEAIKTLDKNLLLKHMDQDAVLAKVDLWDAVELLLNDPTFDMSAVEAVVDVEALVANGLLDWKVIVDTNKLSDASLVNVVASYVTVDASDEDKVKALLGVSDLTAFMDSANNLMLDKVVEAVGVQALIDSDIATVDLNGILHDPAIDTFAFLRLDNTISELKTTLSALSASELETYINKNKALDLVDLEEAVDLLGGYDNVIDYIDVDALLADPDLDLAELVSAVLLDRLVATVGARKIISLVPVNSVIRQISAGELYEILLSINLRPYAKPLAVLVLRKVLSNIDELTIDGELVASEDAENQMLEIHSAALINVIKRIRPTLTDIAETTDGKILSTSVSFKYTVDGSDTQKSKDLILEVVLDGDLSGEQAIAKKISNFLQRYVSYSFLNGTLTVDVNIPAGFARFFNRVLNSNQLSDATKQKLLNVANWDGEHLTGVLERLTTADVVNLLRAVDLDKVYDIALQYAYVQKCVDLASQYSGIDMTDMELDELLDYTGKIPGLKQISNIIKNRYGVDVYAALEKYETTDELYNAALNKAEASVNAFERATDLVIRWIDTYVPETAMDLSLLDGYNGNGNFTLNKSLTMDTKSVAVKAIKRLIKWSGLNIGTDALEILLSQVSEGTETIKFDLSLQVADVYSITYMDRSTGKKLFSAFLPVGADLSVFKNPDSTGGIEITEWEDENGDAITHMPARDVVVYTGRKEVNVTFVDKSGAVLGTVTVFAGDTLADHLETIYGYEALITDIDGTMEYLYDRMDVTWNIYDTLTGQSGGRWYLTRNPVLEDMTVIADTSNPLYFLYMEDVDYDVELLVDGSNMNFVLKIHEELPAFFDLNLDYAHLLQLAASAEKNVTLTILVGSKQYTFLTMDDALLTSFEAATVNEATFHFGTTAQNAEKSVYANDTTAKFFTFEIRNDGVAYGENFVSDLIITLPYEAALTSANGAQQATRIHVIKDDGTREYVERLNDTAGYVSFKAPHFSEYVVSNEYKLNLSFVSTEALDPTEIVGALKGYVATDSYFPAGAALVAIPELSAELANKYSWYATSYSYNTVNDVLYYGETFVMPAAEVSMTFKMAPRVLNVFYHVLGNLYATDSYFFYETVQKRAEDDAAIKAMDPDGTPSVYTWVGFDADLIGVRDMYVHAKWSKAMYTVSFIGRDGKPVQSIEFDETNYYTVTPPAVPLVAGYVGAWSAYDLTSVFGQAEGTVLKVESIYTAATFKIYSDGIVTVANSAKFGETVSVSAPNKAGYDKLITVTLANKTTKIAEDGAFVMPESDVYVDVTYIPHKYTYTINGWEFEGEMNETVTFDIPVPRGKVLEAVPAGCTLVASKLEKDGSLILTYSFELLEDGISINWKWKDSKFNILQIINGKVFSDRGVPVSSNEDAVFLGWSPVVADYLQFAIFGINEEPASWLWLWILIILFVLIGLIVLFYLLHKAGKIGMNRFIAVIVWIVNLFFTVCIAVAEFGLKIAGLFGKGKTNQEYGLEGTDGEEIAETTEEAAEEAAEETAEEAVEETAEEAVEETAEEAVEETAEETAEEAAEETVEEKKDDNQ